MGNLFDGIQRAAFGVVTDTFGYSAEWLPSDGSEAQAAEVLKKEPTQEYELGGVTYTPYTYIIEYHSPSFPGLFDAVASGLTEVITVDGSDYYVRHVEAIVDGKNYRAVIQPA